jgi:hypothetical protein
MPGARTGITVEGGMISGVPENVPASVLIGMPDIAAVNSPDGTPRRPGAQIGTGTVIKYVDGMTLTAVVYGDADGSGTVGLADVNAALSHFRGRRPLGGAYLIAADINKDGNISLAVVNKILSYFRGRIQTLREQINDKDN